MEKRWSCFLFVLAVSAACTQELSGTLTVAYDAEAKHLITDFAPEQGTSYEAGTAFVQFLAAGANLVATSQPGPAACVVLPKDGHLETPLRDLDWDGSVTVTVWHDVPEKPKGPDAIEPEPRPCAGNNVVSRTWTNGGTAPAFAGALEHPTTIAVCDDDRSKTVRITNVGEGGLELRSVTVAPPEAGTVTTTHTMPMTVDEGSGVDIGLEIAAGAAAGAVLVVETDDPSDNHVTIPIVVDAPRLEARPEVVRFAPGESEASVELVNAGCGRLGATSVEIVGIDGAVDDSVLGELEIAGCGRACELPAPTTIRLTYENRDGSPLDVALLRVQSAGDDALRQVFVVAEDPPCVPSEPVFTVTSTAACVGRTIRLEAERAGATAWEWTQLYGPTTEIVDGGDGRASFSPAEAGIYVVGLHVLNACGARSTTQFVQPIAIAKECTP